MSRRDRLQALAWDAAVRAVKTACQSAVALIVANGTGLWDTDWQAILGVSGMAAVVSVLTTIASYGATRSPAVGEQVVPTPKVAALVDAGQVVAGPAAPVKDGTLVSVEKAA